MSTLLKTYGPMILKALLETGWMLLISGAAALIVGLPLGTLIYLNRGRKTIKQRVLLTILNGYVNIVRSFPFILFIVAMIPLTRWVVGTSFGTLAGSFPLAFIGVALYARLCEQALLEVPQGINKSATAMGATSLQHIRYFLYPEARSGLVLGLTSTLISLISYSTIMGVIGGGGIGDFAMKYGYQLYQYDVMYLTIVLMIVLVQLIQWGGSYIARIIDYR